MSFKPFNPNAALRITRQNLPHWRQEGTTYHVTSRLADSVPKPIADEWRSKRDSWLRENGASSVDELADEHRLDYQRLFTDRFQSILDQCHGECVLARRECADLLIAKMIEGHGTCFDLGAWCVMPNHLHAIVTPSRGSVLGDIVKHWKGGSAFAINRLLQRKGTLWMPEPYDHILRSEAQWRRLSQYVADNPREAELREGFVLGFGAEIGLTREAILERIAGL
ncbi:MAG: transposase [Verrucomicrobiaceae bacterium]|nr:transposase [Verrucomicrobiaceae bacterium]